MGGLERYKIPEPPEMMHNVPTHYVTKDLVSGKVPKFDIRRPARDVQLWSKNRERNTARKTA